MATLKDLSVSYLSLVKTPATGKGLTLKSAKAGERAGTFEITKMDDERMVAFGIVYAPDQEDAHGDTADAQTIRRACYEFMREGRLKNIDTEHSFSPEAAYVGECWLVRKGDELFPDEPEGAWAVGIQIGDPDLWRQLKSGELTGISLAGIAREVPDADDPGTPRFTEKDEPGWVGRLIKALTGADPNPTEETDMNKDEVQALVSETLKSVLPTALKDALKEADKPPAKEEPTEAEKVIEKAVAAALKAAGVEPKEPADPAPENADATADVIEKAIAKALGTKVEDAVTKALAKGVTETDPAVSNVEESFL